MTSFSFRYSSSFDPAAGAHLYGSLKPSHAARPSSPDGTGKRTTIFRIQPTSIPSILFGVFLAHDNDSSPDA